MNPVYSYEENHPLNAKKLRVLILDTRVCLLDSLGRAIGAESDIEVVKASSVAACNKHLQAQPQYCSNGNQALKHQAIAAENHDTQIVDLILYCVGVNTHETVVQDIASLPKQLSDAEIVLVSERLEPWVFNLINSKEIAGVVPASFSTPQIVQCLKLVSTGVTFAPTDYLLSQQQQNSESADEMLAEQLNEKLTPRQREVLRYVSLGKSNKYIAAELSLCESTVKVHVHEVMKRLGATSRTHASYIVSNMSKANNAYESETAMA